VDRLILGLKGQLDHAGASEGVDDVTDGNTSEFATKMIRISRAPRSLTDVQIKGLWRDRRNRQVLGWLGGGLVVAVAGLWVAFVYFVPHQIQANCGSVAVGGNISGGATITASSTANPDCAPKAK
jgi:hypothetical protein